MGNLLFDYKKLWLKLKKNWYDFRYSFQDDVFGSILILIAFLFLFSLFVALQLLIFYCIPILILEYIIFKILYLAPILKVYKKSYKHGEAIINHKIFKSYYKLYKIEYNWETNYISDLKIINQIKFYYKSQPINVDFFDFIFTYNDIDRKIIQDYISDIKSRMNLVENKKQKIANKQRSKENTEKLYKEMLKDIQEVQKKEND